MTWAAWFRRHYDLEDWHPHERLPSTYGQAPAYCAECGQLSSGIAWDPESQKGYCLLCYERGPLMRRKFLYT